MKVLQLGTKDLDKSVDLVDQDIYITCHQCHVVIKFSLTKPVFNSNGQESGERICDDCRHVHVKNTFKCPLQYCSNRSSNFQTLPSKFYEIPNGHFKHEVITYFGVNKDTIACCDICHDKLNKAALVAKGLFGESATSSTFTPGTVKQHEGNTEDDSDIYAGPALRHDRGSLPQWLQVIENEDNILYTDGKTDCNNGDSGNHYCTQQNLNNFPGNEKDMDTSQKNKFKFKEKKQNVGFGPILPVLPCKTPQLPTKVKFSFKSLRSKKQSLCHEGYDENVQVQDIEKVEKTDGSITFVNIGAEIDVALNGRSKENKNGNTDEDTPHLITKGAVSEKGVTNDIIVGNTEILHSHGIDTYHLNNNDVDLPIDKGEKKHALEGVAEDLDSAAFGRNPSNLLIRKCKNCKAAFSKDKNPTGTKRDKYCGKCDLSVERCIVKGCKTPKDELNLIPLPAEYFQITSAERRLLRKKVKLKLLKNTKKACHNCHHQISFTIKSCKIDLPTQETSTICQKCERIVPEKSTESSVTKYGRKIVQCLKCSGGTVSAMQNNETRIFQTSSKSHVVKKSFSERQKNIISFHDPVKGLYVVSHTFKKNKKLVGNTASIKHSEITKDDSTCQVGICRKMPGGSQTVYSFCHIWQHCSIKHKKLVIKNFKIVAGEDPFCCYHCFLELKWYIAFLNDDLSIKGKGNLCNKSKKKRFQSCQVGECRATCDTSFKWLHSYDDLMDCSSTELREEMIKKYHLDKSGKGFCCHNCLSKIKVYMFGVTCEKGKNKSNLRPKSPPASMLIHSTAEVKVSSSSFSTTVSDQQSTCGVSEVTVYTLTTNSCINAPPGIPIYPIVRNVFSLSREHSQVMSDLHISPTDIHRDSQSSLHSETISTPISEMGISRLTDIFPGNRTNISNALLTPSTKLPAYPTHMPKVNDTLQHGIVSTANVVAAISKNSNCFIIPPHSSDMFIEASPQFCLSPCLPLNVNNSRSNSPLGLCSVRSAKTLGTIGTTAQSQRVSSVLVTGCYNAPRSSSTMTTSGMLHKRIPNSPYGPIISLQSSIANIQYSPIPSVMLTNVDNPVLPQSIARYNRPTEITLAPKYSLHSLESDEITAYYAGQAVPQVSTTACSHNMPFNYTKVSATDCSVALPPENTTILTHSPHRQNTYPFGSMETVSIPAFRNLTTTSLQHSDDSVNFQHPGKGLLEPYKLSRTTMFYPNTSVAERKPPTTITSFVNSPNVVEELALASHGNPFNSNIPYPCVSKTLVQNTTDSYNKPSVSEQHRKVDPHRNRNLAKVSLTSTKSYRDMQLKEAITEPFHINSNNGAITTTTVLFKDASMHGARTTINPAPNTTPLEPPAKTSLINTYRVESSSPSIATVIEPRPDVPSSLLPKSSPSKVGKTCPYTSVGIQSKSEVVSGTNNTVLTMGSNVTSSNYSLNSSPFIDFSVHCALTSTSRGTDLKITTESMYDETIPEVRSPVYLPEALLFPKNFEAKTSTNSSENNRNIPMVHTHSPALCLPLKGVSTMPNHSAATESDLRGNTGTLNTEGTSTELFGPEKETPTIPSFSKHSPVSFQQVISNNVISNIDKCSEPAKKVSIVASSPVSTLTVKSKDNYDSSKDKISEVGEAIIEFPVVTNPLISSQAVTSYDNYNLIIDKTTEFSNSMKEVSVRSPPVYAPIVSFHHDFNPDIEKLTGLSEPMKEVSVTTNPSDSPPVIVYRTGFNSNSGKTTLRVLGKEISAIDGHLDLSRDNTTGPDSVLGVDNSSTLCVSKNDVLTMANIPVSVHVILSKVGDIANMNKSSVSSASMTEVASFASPPVSVQRIFSNTGLTTRTHMLGPSTHCSETNSILNPPSSSKSIVGLSHAGTAIVNSSLKVPSVTNTSQHLQVIGTSVKNVSRDDKMCRGSMPMSLIQKTATQISDVMTVKLDKICQTGLVYANDSRDHCTSSSLKVPYSSLSESTLKTAVRKEAKDMLVAFMKRLDELTIGCGKELLSELTHPKELSMVGDYKKVIMDQGELYKKTNRNNKQERLRLLSIVALHASNDLIRTYFRRYTSKGDLVCVNEDEIKQARDYARRFGPGVYLGRHSPVPSSDGPSSLKAKTIYTSHATRSMVHNTTNNVTNPFDVSTSPFSAESSVNGINVDHVGHTNPLLPVSVSVRSDYVDHKHSSINSGEYFSHHSSRRKRRNFTEAEKNTLEGFYTDYVNNGKRKNIEEIRNVLHLDKQTINTWFRNRKCKEKKEKLLKNLINSGLQDYHKITEYSPDLDIEDNMLYIEEVDTTFENVDLSDNLNSQNNSLVHQDMTHYDPYIDPIVNRINSLFVDNTNDDILIHQDNVDDNENDMNRADEKGSDGYSSEMVISTMGKTEDIDILSAGTNFEEGYSAGNVSKTKLVPVPVTTINLCHFFPDNSSSEYKDTLDETDGVGVCSIYNPTVSSHIIPSATQIAGHETLGELAIEIASCNQRETAICTFSDKEPFETKDKNESYHKLNVYFSSVNESSKTIDMEKSCDRNKGDICIFPETNSFKSIDKNETFDQNKGDVCISSNNQSHQNIDMAEKAAFSDEKSSKNIGKDELFDENAGDVCAFFVEELSDGIRRNKSYDQNKEDSTKVTGKDGSLGRNERVICMSPELESLAIDKDKSFQQNEEDVCIYPENESLKSTSKDESTNQNKQDICISSEKELFKTIDQDESFDQNKGDVYLPVDKEQSQLIDKEESLHQKGVHCTSPEKESFKNIIYGPIASDKEPSRNEDMDELFNQSKDIRTSFVKESSNDIDRNKSFDHNKVDVFSSDEDPPKHIDKNQSSYRDIGDLSTSSIKDSSENIDKGGISDQNTKDVFSCGKQPPKKIDTDFDQNKHVFTLSDKELSNDIDYNETSCQNKGNISTSSEKDSPGNIEMDKLSYQNKGDICSSSDKGSPNNIDPEESFSGTMVPTDALSNQSNSILPLSSENVSFQEICKEKSYNQKNEKVCAPCENVACQNENKDASYNQKKVPIPLQSHSIPFPLPCTYSTPMSHEHIKSNTNESDTMHGALTIPTKYSVIGMKGIEKKTYNANTFLSPEQKSALTDTEAIKKYVASDNEPYSSESVSNVESDLAGVTTCRDQLFPLDSLKSNIFKKASKKPMDVAIKNYIFNYDCAFQEIHGDGLDITKEAGESLVKVTSKCNMGDSSNVMPEKIDSDIQEEDSFDVENTVVQVINIITDIIEAVDFNRCSPDSFSNQTDSSDNAASATNGPKESIFEGPNDLSVEVSNLVYSTNVNKKSFISVIETLCNSKTSSTGRIDVNQSLSTNSATSTCDSNAETILYDTNSLNRNVLVDDIYKSTKTILTTQPLSHNVGSTARDGVNLEDMRVCESLSDSSPIANGNTLVNNNVPPTSFGSKILDVQNVAAALKCGNKDNFLGISAERSIEINEPDATKNRSGQPLKHNRDQNVAAILKCDSKVSSVEVSDETSMETKEPSPTKRRSGRPLEHDRDQDLAAVVKCINKDNVKILTKGSDERKEPTPIKRRRGRPSKHGRDQDVAAVVKCNNRDYNVKVPTKRPVKAIEPSPTKRRRGRPLKLGGDEDIAAVVTCNNRDNNVEVPTEMSIEINELCLKTENRAARPLKHRREQNGVAVMKCDSKDSIEVSPEKSLEINESRRNKNGHEVPDKQDHDQNVPDVKCDDIDRNTAVPAEKCNEMNKSNRTEKGPEGPVVAAAVKYDKDDNAVAVLIEKSIEMKESSRTIKGPERSFIHSDDDNKNNVMESTVEKSAEIKESIATKEGPERHFTYVHDQNIAAVMKCDNKNNVEAPTEIIQPSRNKKRLGPSIKYGRSRNDALVTRFRGDTVSAQRRISKYYQNVGIELKQCSVVIEKIDMETLRTNIARFRHGGWRYYKRKTNVKSKQCKSRNIESFIPRIPKIEPYDPDSSFAEGKQNPYCYCRCESSTTTRTIDAIVLNMKNENDSFSQVNRNLNDIFSHEICSCKSSSRIIRRKINIENCSNTSVLPFCECRSSKSNKRAHDSIDQLSLRTSPRRPTVKKSRLISSARELSLIIPKKYEINKSIASSGAGKGYVSSLSFGASVGLSCVRTVMPSGIALPSHGTCIHEVNLGTVVTNTSGELCYIVVPTLKELCISVLNSRKENNFLGVSPQPPTLSPHRGQAPIFPHSQDINRELPPVHLLPPLIPSPFYHTMI